MQSLLHEARRVTGPYLCGIELVEDFGCDFAHALALGLNHLNRRGIFDCAGPAGDVIWPRVMTEMNLGSASSL